MTSASVTGPLRRRATALVAGLATALTAALTGCSPAPGSVADEPLARSLVASEEKLRSLPAVEVRMAFDGTGRLASTRLPCFTMTSVPGDPATGSDDRFTLDYVREPSSSESDCRGRPERTTTLTYVDGTLYVTEARATASGSSSRSGCSTSTTARPLDGTLAAQLQQQNSGSSARQLLGTATAISGTERRTELTLDVAAIAQLNQQMSVPSSVDTDDYSVRAVAETDDGGVLSRLVMTVAADDLFSLDIDARYAAGDPSVITVPEKRCTTSGSAITSMQQLQSLLS